MPHTDNGRRWAPGEAALPTLDGAENKPGHKSFSEYNLPKWVSHPESTQTFQGSVNVLPEDYMHGAGDGVCNHYNYSLAHIAALFGDLGLLKTVAKQELSRKTTTGELPAHCAVMAGAPWVLQYLAEQDADVWSKNADSKSPDDLIEQKDAKERDWLKSALAGKLTEKDSVKAEEARIKSDQPKHLANEIQRTVNRPEWLLKMRKFNHGTVDWENLPDAKFKMPPREENLAKRDLPRADFSYVQTFKKPSKPHLPCALIFPGIGTQYVGLMKDVMDNPAVKNLLDKANEILDWDVRKLALEGPEDKISQPLYCQPLLFVACNAALELLKGKHKEEFERVQCVAGLSLGEYCALVAADVFDFETGLRLVKLRAQALDKALNASDQTMCSVAGLKREIVEGICYEATLSAETEGAICQITNSLFPSGFAVGGSRSAVTKVLALAKEAKALQARELKGGGGYHTPLMKSAQAEFGKALDDALPEMRPPRCAIYFNRTGKKVPRGTDPRDFVKYLKEQMTHEVLWETTVKSMLTDGVQDFYEVGPLKQLKAMMKRVDQEAFQKTINISV